MVALNPGKQLYAASLDAVTTNTTGNTFPFRRAIGSDEIFAEHSHGHFRPLDVSPDRSTVLGRHNRRVEAVRRARQ